jgi:hypothetical protein
LKKWMSSLSLIVIVLAIIIIILGYRFTAIGAAISNSSITSDYELVEKQAAGTSVIYLFKSDKENMYRAVLSEKENLLFISRASTYIPFTTDPVRTVGGMSYADDDESITYISIVTDDKEVAYIEAGEAADRKRKEVKKGERVSFLFPFSQQIDKLDAAAYDADGKKLYYYGYPQKTNIFDAKDLKWHKLRE